MDTNRDQEKKDVQPIEGASRWQDGGSTPTGSYQTYSWMSLLEERDRQRLRRELQELNREIEASDGYRFYSRMGLLEKSYFIFDANYLSLKRVLEEFELNLKDILEGFEQPMEFLRLWEEKNRDRFDLFLNDIVRLFHNYHLAGAVTLLDRVRKLQDETYREMDFSEEYQTRWDQQLENTSLSRFVEDLLAHMLHEGLPLALAELSSSRAESEVEVNNVVKLDVSKLGEWEWWSEEGREYLDTLDDKVGLGHIIDEHAAVVANFYRLFVARQTELYQKAIKELEALESKRHQLRQEIRRLDGIAEIAEKPSLAIREEINRTVIAVREEQGESVITGREEQDDEQPATAGREEQDEPAAVGREEQNGSATAVQEKLDNLTKELEAERRYREWDKERADKLEAELTRELEKGFWGRLFGR